MALSTYAELQSAVATWINRDDLTDVIPDFIRMAEARFDRVLLTAEREGTDTLTADAETVALPDDFHGIRTLYIDSDPVTVLEQMPLGELPRGNTGLPQNYAISGGDTLVLAPAPDSEYTLNLNYWQSIPALADDNTSNWLLAAHPDLYLAATLAEAFLFTMDEDRARLWDGRASKQIDEIIRSGRRKSHGGPPRRIRPPIVV